MSGNATRRGIAAAALLACAGAALAAPPDVAGRKGPPDFIDPPKDRPAFIAGSVSRTEYDGVTDDLLTAGLGRSGLAFLAPAPLPADATNPTAAELRRLAIYNNYRALVDTTEGGGYGRLYGPNVTADGTVTTGEGLVAGVEYLAFAGKRTSGEPRKPRHNVTVMAQIPASFDPARPCIVTGTSSGSRGIYGAIGTSGEWGLRNGCAVAYSDKGTGTGAHALGPDTVGLIDGIRVDADEAGFVSTFTAKVADPALRRFLAETPHRFAFKHAHSQENPEASWGRDTLDAVRFAFWALNREFPDAGLTPENTIVIGSSVSNGGGAAVLAAEQDQEGLIDGIAVSEPNVNPRFEDGFSIIQGAREPVTRHSRSLYDYTSLLNVYLGCAAGGAAGAPLNFAFSDARCASLAEHGLLSADDLAGQRAEAQAIINDYGFLEEQNDLAPSHWFLNVPQAIGVTYANAYALASVIDDLCGYSFAAVDPGLFTPVPLSPAAEAILFATSNGIPPTGGVDLINNEAPGGPTRDRESTPDQNLEGHLCLRSLQIGMDPATGARLGGDLRRTERKLTRSVEEIRAGGDLGGRPAIFVTGRSDAVLPPNHTSRAYFGLNRTVEGSGSGLSYVEVLNAQHLDTLNAFVNFGFADRYIPLHHYFNQALDLMLAHLRDGEPLPPSQVVRTTPRQRVDGALQPVTVADNLPPIDPAPAAGDAITFDGTAVRIPE